MSDRPSDDGGSARSDAASRLAALLADVVEDPAAPAPAPVPRPPTSDDAPEGGPGPVAPRRAAAAPSEEPIVDEDATQPIPAVAPAPPDAPPADAPRADAPRADAPRADGPRADGPRADGPRADGPRADGPRADAPPVDAPEDPIVDESAPRPDAPRADGPRADGPRADAPPVDAPEDPIVDESAVETPPPVPVAHDGDDEVLAEARAALRAHPAPPLGPLRKQPGKVWSRATPAAPAASAAASRPSAAERPAPAPEAPAAADPAPPAPAAPAPEAPAAAPAPSRPTTDPAPARPPRPASAAAAAPAPRRQGRLAPAPARPSPGRPAPARPAPPVPAVAATDAGDDDGDDVRPDAPIDDSGVRAPRITVRAVAFGLVFALLVAAVPALGWVGKERLLDSRGGVVVEGGIDSSEPGYRALVNPTPTGLVVHRDEDGDPVSATVLSLGAGDAGGTVLLMPLTLQRYEPVFWNTIIEAYEQTGDEDAFRRGFEDVIGVSVPPPMIDVTDESLATLVAPVAPLELTVNDPVVADDGTTYEGPVSLAAEDVGPYMRATREGEPEIAHLERMRDVWEAWLAAIGDATAGEPIGAAATGMGSYLRVLAAGEPVVETLDVEPGTAMFYLQDPFYVPGAGMEEQIVDAVPFPVTPRAGRRFGMKVLNGAAGETLPMPLMRDLVLAGGSLSTLGNADAFGQEETLIAYADEDWREEAEALQELLGESAEIDQMSARRAEAEAEDMVITIGTDVLSQYEEQEDGGG